MKMQFPLHYLLQLYARSSKSDTYINNYAGFKLLLSWLSPISIAVPTEEFKIWYANNETWLRSWNTQQISKILNIDELTFSYNALTKTGALK